MDNHSFIDTTKDYFENDEFLKIFQEVYTESAQEFSMMLDEISKKYSSNLYWWVSLTASRNPVKSPLYKEFCIVKSIQSFNLLYGKKFKFLVSNSSQQLVLKQSLGEQCPEIHIHKKKHNIINILVQCMFFMCVNILRQPSTSSAHRSGQPPPTQTKKHASRYLQIFEL